MVHDLLMFIIPPIVSASVVSILVHKRTHKKAHRIQCASKNHHFVFKTKDVPKLGVCKHCGKHAMTSHAITE